MAKPKQTETLAAAAERRGYKVPAWQHDRIAAAEAGRKQEPTKKPTTKGDK